MDLSKDIYHKEESPIPSRRKWRSGTDAAKAAPPAPSSAAAPAQPVGTQAIGVAITPIQIARQQMQMQPRHGRRVRRRHRRRDPERSARRRSRVVWILAGLVIFAYLGLLALSVVKKRLHATEQKSKTAAAAKSTVHADVAKETVTAEGALPLAEHVQRWSKGARLLEESDSFLNSSRFPQAREKLLLAGALLPQTFQYALGMGRVYFSERNYGEAEKNLIRAVDMNPGHVEARTLLARALIENGKYADALSVAEWICSQDPYSEEGHDVAAAAALSAQINDVPKGIEHLKKLINLKSEDYVVRNNLGKAYLRVGNNADALKTFEGILLADEQNSAAHYNLAVCLSRQNRPQEAVSTLSRAAVKLGDSFVAAWLNSSDFDPIRGDGAFIALQKRLGANPGAIELERKSPPPKPAA